MVQAADQVFIPNNLPYIVKLKEGPSMQAPAGMVALPSEEVNLHMNKLIRAGLKDAGLQGGLDGGGARRHYRRRRASMVPVATITPSTPRASKSVRISFMVVIPLM